MTPLTPLLPFLETAVTGEWFSWTTPINIEVVRWRLTAQTAPTGSNVSLQLRIQGVGQDVINLDPGVDDTGYEDISFALTAGQVLSFQILSIGSIIPGLGLQLTADINATDATEVRPTQTPYLIEHDGSLVENATLFTYTMTRRVELKSGRATLITAPVGSTADIDIEQNGSSVISLTIDPNENDSGLEPASVVFSPGDILTVVVSGVGSTTAGAGLTVTLDYDILDLIDALVGQYYSEPDAELIQYLKQIGIGNARADAITTNTLTTYKKRGNNIIDSRLAAVYRTPLRTITRNLQTMYPEPIAHIAQRIVGYLLVNDIFSEIEPNASSNAERNYKMAMEDLDSVATRRTLLKGQRYRARQYGSNPYTEPLAPFGGAATPEA